MNKVMITNNSKFSLSDVYEYMAGYETKLRDKIDIVTEKGRYYDNVYVNTKRFKF